MRQYAQYLTVKSSDMLAYMSTTAEIIGERVKLLREEMGISQYVMAGRLTTEYGEDISQGTIGHIEVGRRLPSVPVLLAIANLLDTSTDFLLGRTTHQSSISAIEEDLQVGGISGRLGELYRSLSPDKQRQVYQFAEALALIERMERAGRTTENIDFGARLIAHLEKKLGALEVRGLLKELGPAHLASDSGGGLDGKKDDAELA